MDFDTLFEEHHVHLVRLAGLLTGSNDEAQDIVAEVFARLMRRPPGSVEEPRAYLRRCVVNEVNSVGRRIARRTALGATTHPPSPKPPIDAPIAERDRIARALAQLTRQRRAVIVLRFFEDLSEAQTVALLRIPAGTVKSASSRGAERLRELLREVFDQSARLVSSEHTDERRLGADVLAQLGYSQGRPFLDEALPLLLALSAHERDAEVNEAVVTALGHQYDARAVAGILRHVGQRSAGVRGTVASTLSGIGDVPTEMLHGDVVPAMTKLLPPFTPGAWEGRHRLRPSGLGKDHGLEMRSESAAVGA